MITTLHKFQYVFVKFLIICIVLKQWIYSFYLSLTTSFFSFPEYGGDVTHYLARARMVWLGEVPQKISGQTLLDGMSSNLEYFLYFPALILNNVFGINTYFIYYTFLLIAMTTIIKINLIFRLASKFVVTFKFQTLAVLAYLYGSDLLKIFNSDLNTSLLAARWPVSIINDILILIFLILLFGTLSKKYFLLSCVVIILSFQIYFYSWQFLLSILMAFIINAVLSRDLKVFKKLVFLFLLISPFLIFKLFNLFKNFLITDYDNILYNEIIGITKTHDFQVSKLIIYLLILSILSFTLFEKFLSANFRKLIFIVFLSSFILFNQQIFTGFQVQSGHYHWYFVFPLANFITVILVAQIIEFKKLGNYPNFLILGVNLMLCVFLILTNTGSIYQVPNYYSSTFNILPAKKERFLAFPDRLENYFIFNYYAVPVYTWAGINYPSPNMHRKVILQSLFIKRVYSQIPIDTAKRVTLLAQDHIDTVSALYPNFFESIDNLSNAQLVNLIFKEFELNSIYIDSLQNRISCDSLDIVKNCSGRSILKIQ